MARVWLEARLAAISVRDGDGHLSDLDNTLQQAGLRQDEAKRLLARAWEAAVEGALEDGLLPLDEENAHEKYAAHFGLTQQNLDGNGVQTSLVQAAVIREVTQEIVPQRQHVNGTIPFNLMKSETLVWVIQDVDYLETVVRRERRGTSHGVSIRVARGLYYRPSTFRSRPIECGKTVHAGTGMLGLRDYPYWPFQPETVSEVTPATDLSAPKGQAQAEGRWTRAEGMDDATPFSIQPRSICSQPMEGQSRTRPRLVRGVKSRKISNDKVAPWINCRPRYKQTSPMDIG